MSKEFTAKIEYGQYDKENFEFSNHQKNPIIAFHYDSNKFVAVAEEVKNKELLILF